jgi:hypothetical protein
MSSRDMLDPPRCHLMPDSPGCSEQAHAHALRQVRMTGRPVSVGGQQDQPSGGHRGLPADGHILTLRNRPGEATARERRAIYRHLGAMSHVDMSARSGTAGAAARRPEPSICTRGGGG